MKYLNLGSRLLLGAIFLIFGLNGFLGFIPLPPLPEQAGAFLGAIAKTGYLFHFIKTTEVISGAMILAGFQIPLALLFLTPIALNIFLFHFVLTGPATTGLPILILVLIGTQAWIHRARYRNIFVQG